MAGGLGDRPICGDELRAYQCFLREGAAMWRAVVADFAELPQVRVRTLWADDLAAADLEERRGDSDASDTGLRDLFPSQLEVIRVAVNQRPADLLRAEAARADAVIVIAPECDGVLLQLARDVVRSGGQLWSASVPFIEVTMDKQLTAERLQAAGVPVPDGVALADVALAGATSLPASFVYPAVLKPRDGAGSTLIRRIDAGEAGSFTVPAHPAGWRLERWCSGQAASVAVLCGPSGRIVLPAATQRLGGQTGFEYQGGCWPVEPALQSRATRLAHATLDALPPTSGYVGIDLIFGADPQGRDDVVIEVNPRYTTSYTCLRVAARDNLAAALMSLQLGAKPASELLWHGDSLEFQASGVVTRR